MVWGKICSARSRKKSEGRVSKDCNLVVSGLSADLQLFKNDKPPGINRRNKAKQQMLEQEARLKRFEGSPVIG